MDCVKYEKHIDKDLITSSLNIVKKFIISRKYILVGGQAIDYALRLRGSQIYDECTIPDYDFLAPDSVEAAYDLGEILSKTYENISVINAIHPSTMRVRINFIVVADITYCPQVIFDQLPTINYQGINVIHPLFQRLDMHNSLCNPYENPPRETIFHRWEKDLVRRQMFDEYYPVTIVKMSNEQMEPLKELAIIDTSELDNALITGFVAYWLLMKYYNVVTSLMPKVEIVQGDKQELLSCNYPITLVKDDPQDLYEKGYDHYASWLEKRPDMWVMKNIQIYNSASAAISCDTLSLKLDGKVRKFCIANNEHIMQYFLTMYFETGNKTYFDYYENLYKISIDKKMGLSAEVFASKKDFHLTEFSKRSTYNDIYGKKETSRPANYFPPNNTRPAAFDMSSLKLDGKKL